MEEDVNDAPRRLLEDPRLSDGLREELALAKRDVPLDLEGGAAALRSAIAAKPTPRGLPRWAWAIVAAGAIGLGWSALRGRPSDAPLTTMPSEPTTPASVNASPSTSAEPASPATEPAPSEPTRPSVPATTPTPDPSTPVAPRARAPVSDADLIEEATMIRTASRELSTDPSAALRTIDAARRRFPRGQLVVEREAMRAFAHARLGRSDEAKRLAARLIEEHPTSPFSERLRTVAETGRDPVAR